MGTPMAIIYKVGWLAAKLYVLLVKQKFVGMPNILAEREVAPEFLQDNCTPENILGYLDPLLADQNKWGQASGELLTVRERLGAPGALDRTAELILEVVRKN